MGLPKAPSGQGAICVTVDKLKECSFSSFQDHRFNGEDGRVVCTGGSPIAWSACFYSFGP
jgi:hypothetical protein